MNKEQYIKQLKALLWDLGHTEKDAGEIINFFSSTLDNVESQTVETFRKVVWPQAYEWDAGEKDWDEYLSTR